MSVSAQSNSELIAAYLDAVMRKDGSFVEHLFAPDVEYMVNRTSSPDPAGILPPISADCREALPWLGLHRGREAVKRFLAHMHRNLEVTTFGPREVISEGTKAAAFGWFRLHALSTGRTVDVSYSIRFELQDGLIVKYHFPGTISPPRKGHGRQNSRGDLCPVRPRIPDVQLGLPAKPRMPSPKSEACQQHQPGRSNQATQIKS